MEKNIYDSKAYSFLSNASQVIIVSFLWLFTSIPLLTVGVSTAALYQTISQDIKKDKTGIVKLYFMHFKENFLPSIVPSIIFALYAVVMAMELSNAWLGKTEHFLPPFVWLIIAVLLTTVGILMYASIARAKAGFFAHLGAAFIIISSNFRIALGIVMLLTISLFLIYFAPGIAFLLPGCLMYIISGWVDKPLEKIYSKDE